MVCSLPYDRRLEISLSYIFLIFMSNVIKRRIQSGQEEAYLEIYFNYASKNATFPILVPTALNVMCHALSVKQYYKYFNNTS